MSVAHYFNIFLLAGGPAIQVILQTRAMVKSWCTDGFSPYVSFIVTFCHLIRMFWWYCERFDNSLMYTSVSYFSFQMILLYFWIKIKAKNHIDLKITGECEERFWYWNNFSSYLKVLLPTVRFLSTTTYFF